MAIYQRQLDYNKNLKLYLKDDTIYQAYLKKELKEISDFDRFCINHCEDIDNMLKENTYLKKELMRYKKIENKEK